MSSIKAFEDAGSNVAPKPKGVIHGIVHRFLLGGL